MGSALGTEVVAREDALGSAKTPMVSGTGAAVGRYWAAGAAVLYIAVAVVFERPAITHIQSVCACGFGTDPTQYMWAMKWWPYAILHGLNPFVTHEIWTDPSGFNLAAATSVPAIALVAWPITALAGPLVSFNIAATLAPVLGAWFAYRLCLYVTRSQPASILGGYLFGFSSYELGQMLGHLHLTMTFAIPAAVLLALKRIDGVISRRRYVVLTALVLAVQLLISSELLLGAACMVIVAVVCAWLLAAAEDRARIARFVPELVGAVALMALVCSPFLYYELRGKAVAAGINFSADSLGFLVPTAITRLGGHTFRQVSVSFPGNLSEQGTYLGLPLILIVASFAIRTWRARTTKMLVAVLAIAVLWSLGDHLYVDGHATIWLPWQLLRKLPLLDQLQSIRVALFVSLIAAVIAAKWLAESAGRRRWGRWALAALAVAFLVPNGGQPYPGTHVSLYHARPTLPRFFATDLYRSYLQRGAIVLPIPFAAAPYGYSLYWQAHTDMYFRLASGSFGYNPPSYNVPIQAQFYGIPLTPDSAQQLRALIVAQHVSVVVADANHLAPWGPVLASLHLRPLAVGGVLLYYIPPAWDAAPQSGGGQAPSS